MMHNFKLNVKNFNYSFYFKYNRFLIILKKIFILLICSAVILVIVKSGLHFYSIDTSNIIHIYYVKVIQHVNVTFIPVQKIVLLVTSLVFSLLLPLFPTFLLLFILTFILNESNRYSLKVVTRHAIFQRLKNPMFLKKLKIKMLVFFFFVFFLPLVPFNPDSLNFFITDAILFCLGFILFLLPEELLTEYFVGFVDPEPINKVKNSLIKIQLNINRKNALTEKIDIQENTNIIQPKDYSRDNVNTFLSNYKWWIVSGVVITSILVTGIVFYVTGTTANTEAVSNVICEVSSISNNNKAVVSKSSHNSGTYALLLSVYAYIFNSTETATTSSITMTSQVPENSSTIPTTVVPENSSTIPTTVVPENSSTIPTTVPNLEQPLINSRDLILQTTESIASFREELVQGLAKANIQDIYEQFCIGKEYGANQIFDTFIANSLCYLNKTESDLLLNNNVLVTAAEHYSNGISNVAEHMSFLINNKLAAKLYIKQTIQTQLTFTTIVEDSWKCLGSLTENEQITAIDTSLEKLSKSSLESLKTILTAAKLDTEFIYKIMKIHKDFMSEKELKYFSEVLKDIIKQLNNK